MDDTTRRVLAAGGIIGPAGFITAWTLSGHATVGYSPVSDFISDLAALGSPTRVAMTAGFVCFGVCVPAYAVSLRGSLEGAAWVTAAITGLSTLGVAAFPLRGSSLQDHGHATFAALGYATLALTPLLASRPLARLGHRRAAIASVAIGAVAGASLAASTIGPAHGFFQRFGLTLADAWIIATAVAIMRGRLGPKRDALPTAGASPGRS